MAELVARWVRLYTRKLPTQVAERRVREIDADLHDHIAHERAHGTGDRRIALSVLSRMVRGLAADASWRGRQAQASRSTVRIVLAAAFILLLPLVAMQFTDEVIWGVADFVLAGVLLAGAGLVHSLAARKVNTAYRAGVGLAMATAFMLVFLIGAVGIVGEDGDSADLMYFGALAVGIVGAVIARFQPEGMARALLATAVATALVGAIALIAGKHQAPISSVYEIVGLNGIFVTLFTASAWLFRRAASRA
jgi:hypothetical protein